MICPHCNQEIKYRERTKKVCSKCFRRFAFEPREHSLKLSDKYFINAATKLSSGDKYYFTQSQFHFALSRKKMKNVFNPLVLIIPMIFTTIFASVMIFPWGLLLAFFWIALIIILKLLPKKEISLPEDISRFNSNVLSNWKEVYGKLPDKLIINSFLPNDSNLNGGRFLLCEDKQTAMCLIANKFNQDIAVISNENLLSNLLDRESSVFVLHDASRQGFLYYEKVKRQYGKKAKIISIGLRPQNAINWQLIQFRMPGESGNFSYLTAEENKWLNEGFYTPYLF